MDDNFFYKNPVTSYHKHNHRPFCFRTLGAWRDD